jgi:hypothetical protein
MLNPPEAGLLFIDRGAMRPDGMAEISNAGDDIGARVIARVGLNDLATRLRLSEVPRKCSMEENIECPVESFWLTGSPIQ